MPYIVTVTNHLSTVTVVTTPSPTIQVNDPTTAYFTITESTNLVSITDIVNTTTVYLDAIELRVGDLNDYWRGEWIANTSTYIHGDIVDYKYSLYLLGIYNPDTTIYYPASSVPPDQDSNWRRLVWNEAPRDHLTITNYLDVGTTATIGTNLIVGNSATISGNVIAGGNFTVNGTSNFNGQVNVNSYSDFYNTATFHNGINIPTGELSVYDLTVNHQLTVDGLNYPLDKGKYGQVLVTNGATTSTAEWRNLGDLVYWSLSNDLYTNGFNIITNSLDQRLKIGIGLSGQFAQGGFIEFNNVPTGFEPGTWGPGFWPLIGKGTRIYGQDEVLLENDNWAFQVNPTGINFITDFGSPLTLKTDADLIINGVSADTKLFLESGAAKITVGGRHGNEYTDQFGANNTVNIDNAGYINGVTGFFTLTNVNKIIFSDGSIQTTANNSTGSSYTLTTATDTKLGGIKVGDYLIINSSTGVLSVNTTSFISAIITATTYTLTTATDTTLGGIKVGEYLNINSSTGVLSVNTATLASVTINTATSTLLGGIKVANSLTSNLTITPDGSLSVPIASKHNLGVITPNNGLTVNTNGIVDLAPATTTSIGGIIVGNNLHIDENGRLSVGSSSTAAIVDLQDVMYTNGYPITFNSDSTATELILGSNQFSLISKTQFYDSDYALEKRTSTISQDYFNNTISYALEISQDNTRPGLNGISDSFIEVAEGITILSTSSAAINRSNVNIQGTNINVFALSELNFNSTVTNFSTNKLTFSNPGELDLQANVVVLGLDLYHSELHVQKIYNYDGSYAPFFPAGIQLADQTVQITAYHPDGGPLPGG